MEFCYDIAQPQSLLRAEACQEVASVGIVQIGFDETGIMEDGLNDAVLLSIRDNCREAGLSLKTAHPPFGSYHEPFSLIRQEPDGRREDIAYIKEYIRRCGLLGMSVVPLHTSGAMLPGSQPWEVELAAGYIHALLPAARQAGVKLAVENTNHRTPAHWGNGVYRETCLDENIWDYDDTEKIIRFVRELSDPMVGICYDTGHSHMLGRVLEDYDRFAPYIILVHLHDNAGAYNDQHLQPGYGNTPWQALFARMARLDTRSVPIYIEAPPWSGSLARMKQEMDALAAGRVAVLQGGFTRKDECSGYMQIGQEAGL